jgi:capsular polysaccharide biosynthesis protein
MPEISNAHPARNVSFRRVIPIVLIIAVLGGVAAYAKAKRAPNKYSATAELLFDSSSPLGQLLGLSSSTSSQDAATVSATYVKLASLPGLQGKTLAVLGRGTPGFSVSVAEAGASNLVDVTATTTSPAQAARVANAYTQQFIAYTQNQQGSSVAAAIAALNHEIQAAERAHLDSTQIASLRSSLAQLRTIGAVRPVNVSVAQAATAPTAPSSPHPTRQGLLGLLVGAVIGLAAALLITRIDPRLHSLAAVEADDAVRRLQWRERLAPFSRRGARPAEGGSSARRALRQLISRGRGGPDDGRAATYVVTSTPSKRDGDAGMTIAWELASTAANLGRDSSVLLFQIGDDASDPGLPEWADAPSWHDVLDNRATVEDAIQRVPVGDDAGAERYVDVLRPAAQSARATDDEPGLAELINALSSSYRYIFVATPSPEQLGSAGYLITEADAVVASVRLHRTHNSDARDLLRGVSHRRIDGVYLIGYAERRRAARARDQRPVPRAIASSPT